MSTEELTIPGEDTLPTDALVDWLSAQRWSDFAQDLARDYGRRGHLTPAQDASARRMYARTMARRAERAAAAPAAPAAPATPAADPVTPGFYVVDGYLWKVVRAGHGGLYAERRGESGGWQYVRGGIRAIKPEHRVTAEQAVAHGLRTGVCLFCNAELDDREGLGPKVGVGPVCARKHLGMTQRQLAESVGITL